jgi:hypothetical protein
MLNTNGNINNSITLNLMSSPNINSLNSENLIGPSLSSKIEKFIQESQGVTIPSIVFEYLSKEDKDFEYKDLKNFYEQFGDIDEFELNGKISVVLFKSFFAANVCREFLSNEHNFKDNLKKDFKVKWFEIDKDSELIDQKLLEKFQKIDEKNKFYLNLNLKNLKNGKNKNKQSNNNNDLDINDNSNNEMGMKINFNINMNNVNNVNLNNNINGFSNINGNNINGFYNGKGNNININSQIMNNNQTDLQNLFNNLQIANNINNKFPINNINNINTINNINNFNNNIITNNFNSINNSYVNQNNHNNQNSIIINHNSINQNNIINNNSNIGKYICKYEILIPNEKDFRIAKRIIGSKGNNMKKIVDLVQGIKLRLRGKGSGFKEGPKNKESDEPLHLCISSKNIEEMNRACLLINNLLEKIYEDYKIYCYKNGLIPVPQIAIKQDIIFSYRKNSH